MNAIPSSLRQSAFPLPTVRHLGDALVAGVVGLVVWEFFARAIAPFWLGHALDPTGLVEAALGIGGGGALAVHLATGLLAFPLGYLLVVRPLARAAAPRLPDWALGLGYGVVLWVFALYGVASLLGGMPAFLGFGDIAWASLVGHLALGLAVALTVASHEGTA